MKPRPDLGAVFVGFEGACVGSSECEVATGEVSAVFTRIPDTLAIEFVGDGGGVVRTPDDSVRCTASCVVPFAPGSRLELVASANARSFFDGFVSPCLPNACVIREAGAVRARFEAGRWVGVSLTGSGDGGVEWDGGVLCPGACGVLLRTDAGAAFVLRPGPTSFEHSVEPACAERDGGLCRVGDGVNEIVVRFDSVLRWSRAFEVYGSDPYVRTQGYLVNQRALPAATRTNEVWVALEQREFIVIDGTERPRPTGIGNGTGTGLFVSLSLDDGHTLGVVGIENPDGGYGGGDIKDMYELPDAGVLAFIRCGIAVHDLPCPTGAAVFLLRGGTVVAKQSLGVALPTEARGAGLDWLGRPLVALIGAGGLGLLRLAPALDQPPTPLMAGREPRGICGRGPQGVRCSLGGAAAGSGGVCGLPVVPPGTYADLVVDVDAEGCRGRVFTPFVPEVLSPSLNFERGPLTGRFPPHWFHSDGVDYGVLGSVDGGAFTVQWYSDDGGVEAIRHGEVADRAIQPAGGMRLQARVFRAASLTGHISGGESFFGRPTGEPGFVIGVWDRSSHELSKIWFVAGEILASNATVSADERGVTLVLIAKNLRFDGRPLAPDPARAYEFVLFFDDR